MKAELKSLRNRRKKLTQELKLLDKKEEVLLSRTTLLEGRLESRWKMEKSGQFERAREKLEALEDLAEKSGGLKDVDLRTQLKTLVPRGNQPAATEGISNQRNGPKLNRVRVKSNATFSWSYTKLS